MVKIIGSCSICGGQVTIPESWMGTPPPVPSCVACGAVKRTTNLPTIEMIKPTDNGLLLG